MVRRTRAEWQVMMLRFERSGKSGREFCEAEGPGPETFSMQHNQYERSGPMPHLAKFVWRQHTAVTLALAALAWLWPLPVAMAQDLERVQVPAAVAPDRPHRTTGPGSATRLDYRTDAVAVKIELDSPDAADAAGLGERNPGEPLQIGFTRPVTDAQRGDLLANAIWNPLADGVQVTSVTLRSPGATRLRAALQAALPEGAKLRFFGFETSDRSSYPVYTRELFLDRGAGTLDKTTDEPGGLLWSPIVEGEVLGIEIELPADAKVTDARLSIVRASHIVEEAARSTGTNHVVKADGSCPLVDVACKDLTDFPKNAVTRLVFTDSDGETFGCSGTIINTHRPETDNSLAPYLLTAHHCIPTRDVADSIEFDFFYEHRTCDGSVVSDEHVRRRSGARLLVTDPASDLSLLELRSSLPPGASLAGWTTALQDTGSDVASVSHPQGEPQKYASGTLVAYGVSRVSEYVVDRVEVAWTEGLTLSGSSGGGLWALDEEDEEWRLIAALSGEPADDPCPTEGAAFGRFDVFFVNEAQRWLSDGDPTTDDHAGSIASATGILPGSETSGAIDNRADADMFRIVLTEPGMLVLTTTGGTNTVGRLLRGDGSVIKADAAGGYAANFRVAAYLEAGTYYIRVSGWDPSSVGNYRLHASFTADSERPAAEIPLFLAASDTGRQGFIRLLNAADRAGTVDVTAFDDEGVRHGPVTVSLDAEQTRHFNSDDLENGNTSKGLAGRTGSGTGDWRLRFDSDLPIEVASYIRTPDGFLTTMHDAVHFYPSVGQHFVSIFNPGSNTDRLSKLRLINPDTSREVRVVIFGEDDAGRSSAGAIELTLSPGASRTVDATQLEAGGSGLTGSLGDGQGKWRLWVEAEGDIVVLNLLESASGHLANLSSPGHILE